MTAIFVFAALIIVNIAYTCYDNRRIEREEMMDNYYRVEYKKNYRIENEVKEMKSVY